MPINVSIFRCKQQYWTAGHSRSGRSTVAAMAILGVSVSWAPSAVADGVASLRAAVISARPACSELRSVPVIEEAAEIVNRSTDRWLDHTGRAVPVSDPLPILSDLGYGGSEAVQIEGAGDTESDAIAGLLLIGHETLSDCTFTDYGVNLIQNQATGHYLAAVVLGGA